MKFTTTRELADYLRSRQDLPLRIDGMKVVHGIIHEDAFVLTDDVEEMLHPKKKKSRRTVAG